MDYKNLLIKLQELQDAYCEGKYPNPEVDLGFKDLNRTLFTTGKGSLCILGSRPSMGKTSLLLSMAVRAAEQGNATVFVSLEENEKQLGRKVLSLLTEIESEKIYTGRCSTQEFQKLVECASNMDKLPLKVFYFSDKKIGYFREFCSKLETGTLLLLDGMDYLFQPGVDKSNWMEPEILAMELKNIANDYSITLLASTNLSRRTDERFNHRPMISDMKNGYEKFADVVMFLLRREYYDPLDKPGTGELVIAKNRTGSAGNVLLTYRKEIGKFSDFEPETIFYSPEEGIANLFKAFSPN